MVKNASAMCSSCHLITFWEKNHEKISSLKRWKKKLLVWKKKYYYLSRLSLEFKQITHLADVRCNQGGQSVEPSGVVFQVGGALGVPGAEIVPGECLHKLLGADERKSFELQGRQHLRQPLRAAALRRQVRLPNWDWFVFSSAPANFITLHACVYYIYICAGENERRAPQRKTWAPGARFIAHGSLLCASARGKIAKMISWRVRERCMEAAGV